MISIVVPTIPGREDWLERCVASYERTLGGAPHELIVEVGHATCGLAWQAGIGRARGEYVHLTADDLEAHDGWVSAAINAADSGVLVAGPVYNADGSLQSCGGGVHMLPTGAVTEFTRVPFMSREQTEKIGPMFSGHYFTDNYVSHRGRIVGYPTVVSEGYAFTHHWAQEGRVDERYGADREDYLRMIA